MSLGLGWANMAVAGVAGPPPPPCPDLLALGTPRGLAERRPPEGALRNLLRGLRAGDLDTVLLTVEMAADENLLPFADPNEAARILAFLTRLAEHDTMLPPLVRAARAPGSEGPPDGTGAEDRAPARGGRHRRWLGAPSPPRLRRVRAHGRPPSLLPGSSWQQDATAAVAAPPQSVGAGGAVRPAQRFAGSPSKAATPDG